jgi:hypothetical protein
MTDADAGPSDDRDRMIAGKVAWRLAPLLMLCYFVAFLDRVNDRLFLLRGAEQPGAREGRGARLDRPHHVHLGPGIGRDRAGLERAELLRGPLPAGRRRGRLLPGVVLYLTYWFPAQHRAKMVGLFMAAVPVSGVIGAPLSGWLLGLDRTLGLHGWQWLFILEGLPSMLLSAVVWRHPTDQPRDASWLTASERT